MKKYFKLFYLFAVVFVLAISIFGSKTDVYAASDNILNIPNLSITMSETDNPQQTASAVQMLLLLSIITLVPSILLMMTCFPRLLIAFHFLRSALGTQQMPPNQILIALALFLSFFMLNGEIMEINETALQPYIREEISQEQAIENAMIPMRNFMFRQVEQSHLDLMASVSGNPYEKNEPDTIPNSVLIPAFMITELTQGFIIGVIIYVPFIVIDMVVASTLMAMGMMMLPPAMISLPFKIILFVLCDGWNLVIKEVLSTFR